MNKLHLLIMVFFLMATSVYGCQPCDDTLNLKETVEKSDLIIIGQRTEYSPGEEYEFGPEFINVTILSLLKGTANEDQITVNSWDGMCPYGIVVDDKEYVMFLQKRDTMYDAVDFGCSVKTYKIVNNRVDFKGDLLTIEEFTDQFESNSSIIYYVLPVVVLLLIFILRKKK